MTELLPPPERDIPVAVVASIRRRALGESRLTRRRLLLALAVAVLCGAAASAYAITRTTGDRVDNAVACHNQPALSSSVTGILDADGSDPIELCAESMWRARGVAVPAQVACSDVAHGQVDVFPSDDPALCERLGLGPVPVDFRAASARLSELTDDLVRTLGSTCRSHADALRLAREVLDRHGFADWTIETLQFDDAHPCVGRYSIWRAPQRHVIGLTAMTRRNASG